MDAIPLIPLRSLSLVVVAGLLSGCDSPISEPTALADQAALARASEGFSDAALLVGNFIPMTPGNSILRYDVSGRFVDVMVELGLSVPRRGGCCLDFGPDEHLYVNDGGGALRTGRINRFNGVTGEFIDEFVAPGAGGLMRPLVVVFGPDGHLYVGDIGSNSIRRFDGASGEPRGELVSADRLGGSPQLFVFGPDGNVYVVVPSLNAVRRFDGTSGAYIDDFITGTDELRVRSGLTFGPDGHLYVGTGDGVNRYDGVTGEFIDAFVEQRSGGLSVPVGMTFGPDGDFYVASPGSAGDGSILRYDGRSGEFVDAFIPSTEPHITGPRVLLFKSKIAICHAPPSNPSRARTISVGYLPARDHVAHGDAVGRCE